MELAAERERWQREPGTLSTARSRRASKTTTRARSVWSPLWTRTSSAPATTCALVTMRPGDRTQPVPSCPRWQDWDWVVTLTTERPAVRIACDRATAGSGSRDRRDRLGRETAEHLGEALARQEAAEAREDLAGLLGNDRVDDLEHLRLGHGLRQRGVAGRAQRSPRNQMMRLAASVTTTAPSTESTRRSDVWPTRCLMRLPTRPPRNWPSQPKATTPRRSTTTRVRSLSATDGQCASTSGSCHTATMAKAKKPTSEKTLWMSPCRYPETA